MPGNNLRVRARQWQHLVRRRDHPADLPAGSAVDVRIKPIKKRVPHMDDIRLFKNNVDVRVRMRGRKMLQHHIFAICLQSVTRRERLLRQSLRRRRVEMQAHHRQIVRLGHSLLRIFMRQHRCPRRVQRRVVVRMVEMPVRINHRFHGRAPQPFQRLLQLRPRR